MEFLCLAALEILASAGEFKPRLSFCCFGLGVVQLEGRRLPRTWAYAMPQTGSHKLRAMIGNLIRQ